MSDNPNDEQLLSGLGQLAREGARRAPGSDDDDAGKARLIRAIHADRRPSAVRRAPAAWLGLAAALSLAVALVLWWSLRVRPIECVVEGAQLSDGGFVQAPAEASATVRFSDGSHVTLAPGARGRINDFRARGARFSVETGKVEVEVKKREGGADYIVDAGPYAVRVTGTRFELSWDPAFDRMRLDLFEGSVVITGPQAEAGVGLRAGQRVELDALGVRVGETSSASSSEAPTASAASPATASAPSASAQPAPSGSAAAAQKAERAPTWAERVANGDFEGVLADAEARGLEATLASAPAGDLMTLADAARYGGRARLASDALSAVRSRFPRTKSASTAAFLLGRMAEDGSRTDAAIRLYDATLAEGGTFASEALGRKMLLLKRRSGNDGARSAAEQYLKSYPRGPYASAASAIVGR